MFPTRNSKFSLKNFEAIIDKKILPQCFFICMLWAAKKICVGKKKSVKLGNHESKSTSGWPCPRPWSWIVFTSRTRTHQRSGFRKYLATFSSRGKKDFLLYFVREMHLRYFIEFLLKSKSFISHIVSHTIRMPKLKKFGQEHLQRL